MKKLTLSLMLIWVMSVPAWAGKLDVVGYGKWKGDDNQSGIFYVCSLDKTNKGKTLFHSVNVGTEKQNISFQQFDCNKTSNIIDAAFNAKYGASGAHCSECAINYDLHDGLDRWVAFKSYYNRDTDFYASTQLPGADGSMPSSMTFPGTNVKPPCHDETVTVCPLN